MSTTDLPGASLLANRYRLVERLGAGGMSVVWRGFDEVLGRQVAVKVLPPSTSADPAFRRRLRAEAQAAARLSHHHITNVYDYGEATTVDGEPVPYVVMELVDGESLAAVLARVQRLPWQAAVRIASEVAAALAAAHARGIVHRDVTPSNVMLTSGGVKVVDFGISALIGENDIDPDGSLLGTPAYLAPERLEGGQVSPATDVYAVGLLIYRTLIGQLPWDVGTTTALLRAHQYTEPDPLPPVDGLPPAVAGLIADCLRKNPADRPSSAELADVLGTAAARVPAADSLVPDWADTGENTTILPGSYPRTDPLDRLRSDATPPQPRNAREGMYSRAVPGPVLPDETAPRTGDIDPAVVATGLVPPAADNPVATPALRPAAAPLTPAEPVSPAPPAPPAPPVPPDPPVAPAGPERKNPLSRHPRMALVSGILVAAVAGGWAIAAAAGNDEGKPAGAVPPRPAGNPCVVSYSVWSDAKKRFKAAVILANRDTRPMAGWKLWFVLSGDQKVTGTGVTALRQNANAVTMSQPAPLQPQGTVTMQMTGRYQASNAAPMVFQLDGKPCDAYVSDAPGEPSRPVEVLPNGSIRLGAPVRQAPVPGISVDPDGVAVPVPVESDPAGDPSGGTDPSSSTDPGGGTDPGDDTSTDPGTGTGTDEPGTGTGTDEPGTGTGTDEPGTGTGTDEPDTGTGTGEPGGGNENPDPKPPGPDTGEPEEPEDPTAPVIDTEPPEAVDNDPVTVSEQSSAGGASAHEISASQT